MRDNAGKTILAEFQICLTSHPIFQVAKVGRIGRGVMQLAKKSIWAAILAGLFLISVFRIGVALADKRVALVIGNSNYQNVPKLPNPAADASAMAQMFKDAGFSSVDMQIDVTNLEYKRAIRRFEDRAADADIAVVFYAGHGIELRGINYMIPVDAKLADERDAPDEAIVLDRIVEAAEGAKGLRLIIIDACRDNPFKVSMRRQAAQRTISRGLAKVEPQGGETLIAYAAKAGSTAEDGNGRHSPLTTALLDNLTVPGLDVRLAFGRVRDEVLKLTGNRQEPFVYGSLGGGVTALVPQAGEAVEPAAANIKADYELVKEVGSIKAWEVFLGSYKTGFYADLARVQLEKLKANEKVATLEPLPSPAPAPAPVTEEEREWDKIKDATDQRQALEEFIKHHPKSTRAIEAEHRLEILKQIAREQEEKAVAAEWDKIKDTSDQRTLQAFIKRNLGSQLAQNARMRLDTLQQEEKARAEWDKIKGSSDQAAVESFLARHPDSALVPSVQGRLDALQQTAKEQEAKAQGEWGNLKESSDPAALKAFIARFPNSALARDAQSRLETLQQVLREREANAAAEWEKLKGSNDQAALQTFIGRYLNSPFVQKAQKRLDAVQRIAKDEEQKAKADWEKLKNSRDQAALQSFIARHASSPLLPDAQSRLADLQRIAKGEEDKARAEREAAQKRAEEEWDSVNNSTDQVALQRFIKGNPGSPLAVTAQRLLETLAQEQEEKARVEWDKIKDSTDQAAFQSFIAGNPNSPLVARAQSRLETIQQIDRKQQAKARADWDKIKDSNDPGAMQSFIVRYPKSPLGAEAQARLESLRQAVEANDEAAQTEWEKIKDSADQTVLSSFIARYPGSSVTPNAQSRLRNLLIRTAQAELSRLGCFLGEADGTMNTETQSSISRYFSRRGRRTSQVAVTESFVSELRSQKSRVCPLECGSGLKAEGDTCVADTKPSTPTASTKEDEVQRKPKIAHGPVRQELRQGDRRT